MDIQIKGGQIAPIKGIEELLEDRISKKVIEAALNASSVQLWYDQYLPPAVAQAHLDGSQGLFNGTTTSEQAAKMFQQAMQEYLASQQ